MSDSATTNDLLDSYVATKANIVSLLQQLNDEATPIEKKSIRKELRDKRMLYYLTIGELKAHNIDARAPHFNANNYRITDPLQ